MKFVFAAALAVFSFTSVDAQSIASSENTPDLVRTALSAGFEAEEGAIWRYTMRADFGEPGSFTGRYDGSRPEAEQWTLVSPSSLDQMSDELRDSWQDMIAPDDEPEEGEEGEESEESGGGASFSFSSDGSGLFFTADSADIIGGDVREVRSETGRVHYTFRPDMAEGENADSEDAAFNEHVAGELIVAQSDPFIESIRVFAPESFKPHFLARIHEFELVLEFVRQPGLPAPVLSRVTTRVEASALGQQISQGISFQFSDVEYIAP